MCRTAILKNNSTAEKRREEETFALASGAGKIGRRSLSRTEKEGAWTRVALKKGHILEGYRNAGEFFVRVSERGWVFWKGPESGWLRKQVASKRKSMGFNQSITR